MSECSIDIPQTPQVTEKAEDEGGKGTQSISSIPQTPQVTEKAEDKGGKGTQSISSIPQTPQVTEKAEDEGGKGTQSISSSIRQTPEITEKTEDEGGKTIDSSMQKSIDNRPGSSQPPEKANYQVGIPVPLGLFQCLPDRPENIESLLLARDRQCNFEELVKNMIGDTPKIREWYVGVERRLSESNRKLGRMMDPYSDEELGRMMARSGLLLLEFLRFLSLPDLPRSSKEFFQPKERQLSVQEAVIKIDNQIPFFVLKKILEWERDAEWDAERDADTDLHSILKDAWLKLSPILYDDSPLIAEVQLNNNSHLLQFLYENIIGDTSDEFKHKRRVRHISLPQAEPLKGKGVKFAPNEGPLNKICFNRRNRRLYLPTIKMDGGTAAVLRNLVLFEASKQLKESQPLMSYVGLMERLIDTAEDVEALRDDGIIQCHLATNIEAANVWNGMRYLLLNKKIKYEPIDKAIYDVRRLYTSKCRIIYTEFQPWIVLSVISACILLGLTGLQTYLAWEKLRLQQKGIPKT